MGPRRLDVVNSIQPSSIDENFIKKLVTQSEYRVSDVLRVAQFHQAGKI
jgi:hypothetical protein